MRRREDNIRCAVLEGKSVGKKPRGGSRKRWLNFVKEDLNRMEVQEWSELVQDREKWREIVRVTKTLREY